MRAKLVKEKRVLWVYFKIVIEELKREKTNKMAALSQNISINTLNISSPNIPI